MRLGLVLHSLDGSRSGAGRARLHLNPSLNCTVNPLVVVTARSTVQRQMLVGYDQREAKQDAVENGRDEVSRIRPRVDPGNGVHAPVEAECGRQ